MRYYVIEIQTGADGTAGNFVFAFAEKNDAMAKYHTVLAAAAASTVMVHSCAVLTREGQLVASECFVHPAEEAGE